jgi:hypothetical protein
VSLVSPAGLPVSVGWFNNQAKRIPLHPDTYALTSYPERPDNTHHRVIIEQLPRRSDGVLIEEDSDLYLEGIDDLPHTLRRDTLTPAGLADAVAARILGCFVLTTSAGQTIQRTAWQEDVVTTVELGGDMIKQGDYLAMIDLDFLRACAAAQKP